MPSNSYVAQSTVLIPAWGIFTKWCWQNQLWIVITLLWPTIFLRQQHNDGWRRWRLRIASHDWQHRHQFLTLPLDIKHCVALFHFICSNLSIFIINEYRQYEVPYFVYPCTALYIRLRRSTGPNDGTSAVCSAGNRTRYVFFFGHSCLCWIQAVKTCNDMI